MKTQGLSVVLVIVCLGYLPLGPGCGAARYAASDVALPPLAVAETSEVLTDDLFRRDASGSIGEDDLKRVLAAPVFLEDKARLGIVPVRHQYSVDDDVPLDTLPGELVSQLGDAGLFDLVTEVSTDWPADGKISGLRELAARYRSEYLLLVRHRFVDYDYTNEWAVVYLTLVGAFFVPSNTLSTRGVVEATLFDVKTGTLLFTVQERVRAESKENIWQNDRKKQTLQEELLVSASKKLSEQVILRTRALAAARPSVSPTVSGVSFSESGQPDIVGVRPQ